MTDETQPPVKRKRQQTRRKAKPGEKAGDVERIAERQQQAMDLRKSGETYRAIAKALGVSVETAYSDVQTGLRETIALRDKDAEEYREQELTRIDAMLKAIWSKVEAGEPQAVEVARKLSESRRKLLGIDAPTKIAPTSPDGLSPASLVIEERLGEQP